MCSKIEEISTESIHLVLTGFEEFDLAIKGSNLTEEKSFGGASFSNRNGLVEEVEGIGRTYQKYCLTTRNEKVYIGKVHVKMLPSSFNCSSRSVLSITYISCPGITCS
ncbi:hypothetical protein CAEBREN_31085 [Caenorhabditis brenneri]|uniref:Uncharacterized protein n=1 Tax=Caenorhabditis brenneri TaxID=135651 RepID=G0N9F5_CAEBE|nr:hypothetical protein CAEBREN_31085 [Caenorhabditis brenneri]